MSTLVGQRWILMVAQMPFEVDVAQGTRRESFCTLRPITSVDGNPARASDFPNQGLVFWLVDPRVRDLARPGMLVTGRLEHTTRPFNPDDDRSHIYQIDPDEVSQLSTEDGIEILSIRDAAVKSPMDLIRPSPIFRSRRPVSKMALARWNGSLWGPFATEEAAADPFDSTVRDVRLEPPSDYIVHRILESKLGTLPKATRSSGVAEISLISQLPSRSTKVEECPYELLVGGGLPSLLRISDEKLSLRPVRVVLLQLAKTLLTRRQRQELGSLLDVLAEKVPESGSFVEEDAKRVLEAVREGLRNSNAEVSKLTDAIIESGVLKDTLDVAIAARIEEVVHERAILLNSQAEARARTFREELESLRREKETLSSELDAKRRSSTERLNAELSELRGRQEAEIQKRLAEVATAEARLQQLERTLRDQIEDLTNRFETARRDVVAEFVSMLPLLKQLDLVPSPGPPSRSLVVTANSAPPEAVASEPMQLPRFVRAARGDAQSFATEVSFLDHVLDRAKRSGLGFRRLDVIALHISIKSGGLTALGGASGTGKTSLCRLFGQSLGASGVQAESRFLPVTVNPSWLDPQDLLGHVNALTRSFQPAEAKLFEQLVAAQEEFRTHGDASGMYVICLDEMNLAQPEHYFSSFLQLLERPADQRRLNVFSSAAVGGNDPFAPWHEVDLPPTVIFVGTVNFDETTRPLSLRLLDRTNLMRLQPADTLTDEATVVEETASLVPGGVSYRQWRSWNRSLSESPKLLTDLLEGLSPALDALGCPITPRRHRGIRRFLGNSVGLCAMEDAIDLQISMRVLPQVRGLLRRTARDAVVHVRSVLEKASSPMRESLRVLNQIELAEFGDLQADEE